MNEATALAGSPIEIGAVAPSESLPWTDSRGKDNHKTSASQICVVYASCGRAGVLEKSLGLLDNQTRAPNLVIISAVSLSDTQGIEERTDRRIVRGKRGLARQRNRALAELTGDMDYVVFFDDDFVPHRNWLAVVERCFAERADVVAVTGHIAADGIKGPGLSLHQGLMAIAEAARSETAYQVEGYSPYGCNMAFRMSAIRDLLFDERLVLYSWLEDRDFGGALSRRGGTLVKLGAAIGAHLGVKAGRISGRRLGYSQVVNPIYLYRKGTMTASSLTEHLARNIIANVVRSLAPETHIDRAGRLRGNLAAIADVMRGIAAPERAEMM